MPAARALLTAIVAAALLSGCGAPSGGDGPSPAVPGDDPVVRPTPSAFLTVTVRDRRGGSEEASLSCAPGADRATGYLRLESAPDLCRRLGELKSALTSQPPRDRVCAQVDGGPLTARISGRLDGRRVDRRLARTDACEIDEWDRLDILLPDVS